MPLASQQANLEIPWQKENADANNINKKSSVNGVQVLISLIILIARCSFKFLISN